jgi:hypothetical protein
LRRFPPPPPVLASPAREASRRTQPLYAVTPTDTSKQFPGLDFGCRKGRVVWKDGLFRRVWPTYMTDDALDDYTHVPVYSDKSLCDFLTASGFPSWNVSRDFCRSPSN